jgi:hypothetical protein
MENVMGRACSTNGEKRIAYKVLVVKPEGKTPLRRPRHRWVDNIELEIGLGVTDLIKVAQDRDQWRALV